MTTYKSFYPLVCLQSPIHSTWYIIANGDWHQVTRQYLWTELESMWERVIPKPVVRVKTKVKKTPLRFSVQGSRNNTYEVVNNNDVWTCSCPAHGFGRGKDCKHIEKIKHDN